MEERLFRQKVTWFQSVCCVLVIWGHSSNAELFLGKLEQPHPLNWFETEFTMAAVRVSIPCFLMISAYLFFRGFTLDKLPGKWKRRIKTLLLPYLAWNFLYYAGYLAGSRIKVLEKIVNRPRMVFSWRGMLEAVFFYQSNPVFWFMYQLLLLVALAPVIYLFLHNACLGIAFLLLLLVGIASQVSLPHLNLDALFYYAVAAYLALHGKKEVEKSWSDKRAIVGGILLSAGMIVSFFYYKRACIPAIVLYHVLAVFGLWLLVDESRLGKVRGWMKNTFFIYAFHFIPVRLINKSAAVLLMDQSRFLAYGKMAVRRKSAGQAACIAAVLFLAMPVMAIGICSLTARVLGRFAPGLWKLLNGGRGSWER